MEKEGRSIAAAWAVFAILVLSAAAAAVVRGLEALVIVLVGAGVVLVLAWAAQSPPSAGHADEPRSEDQEHRAA